MVSQKVTIINPMGMHMRPAQLFVNEMSAFPCEVTLHADGREANGKSILHLMAACLKKGTEVEVRCDGAQEKEALEKAVELISSGLGEA